MREEWLTRAVKELKPLFTEVGEEVPNVRVSVGWPGGRGRKDSVIGQAWAKISAKDGVAQVFISPVLEEAPRVLDVLVHELVHVVDENESGHKGRFKQIATDIGLTGKMTATVAGDALRGRLEALAADLGPYPHSALTPASKGGPAKQTTRMLKTECIQSSGYIARLTKKWLDEYGTPICPCHNLPMREAETPA